MFIIILKRLKPLVHCYICYVYIWYKAIFLGNLLDIVAEATKVARSSVVRIVREGQSVERGEKTTFMTVATPKSSPKSSADNFAEEAIRRIIFNFHITDKQKPTVKMVYNKIKDDEAIGFTGKIASFRIFLHKIGFR